MSLIDTVFGKSPERKRREYEERMKSLAKSTVGDFDITFKAGDEWTFEDKKNVMYYVPEDLEKLKDRQVIALILHEMAHALHTSTPSGQDFKQKVPDDKERIVDFFRLMNSIEDIRVEELMMQKYPGVYDNFIYKFRKKDSQISAKIENELPAPIQYVYSLQRAFWGKDLLNVKKEVVEALEESEDALFEAYQAKTTMDMFNIAADKLRPIYKRLLDEEEKKEDEDSEGEGEGKGGGMGGGGSALSKEDQEKLKELLKDNKSLELGQIEKALAEMSQDINPEDKESKSGESNEEDEQEGLQEKADFGKDIDEEYDARDEAKASRYGQTEPITSDYKKGGHEEPRLAESDYMSYEQMYSEILPVLPFFKSKIKSIMKDNRYNRRGGAYRTGKLNTKKLYRWKAGSDRIFSRKIIRHHKDYMVTLLVDESGSMCSNEKNRNAAKATVLFSEVLSAAEIPFEIRGFNEYHRCYKQAHEKFNWKHRRQIERIIVESHSRGAGYNNDGFAVNQAAHHLRLKGGEGEKILIVLSDGLPANAYCEIPDEDKKRLPASKWNVDDFDLKFEIAQASKYMTVIGVGIRAHHVQDYYEQNVICDDVNELPRLVLNRLKANIRRG